MDQMPHLPDVCISQAVAALSQKLSNGNGGTIIQQSLRFLPSLIKSSPLPLAIQLHATIFKSNLSFDPAIHNSLLSLYSKHFLLNDARKLFDAMLEKDSVSYSSMINCYMKNKQFFESISVFKDMHFAGFIPKPELVAALLSVCGKIGNISYGKQVHALAVCRGWLECVMLSTSVIGMYSRCNNFEYARIMFDLMPQRNVVSWTAMVTGCVMNERYCLALEVFRRMVVEGIRLNRVTLISTLNACSELGNLKNGKEIHCYAIRQEIELEIRAVSALIDMYGKHKGGHKFALSIFERTKERDIVIWSSMMGCSSRYGDYLHSFGLFKSMRDNGVEPNVVTMLAVLEACVWIASFDYGRGIHGCILKYGLLSDVKVGNSLIDMYAKCGHLESSFQVFGEISMKDSISYGCMISSYGLHGRGYEALKLFNQMQEKKVKPDDLAYLAVLFACNHAGLVDDGKKIFSYLTKKHDKGPSLEHYACYIDLLAKHGLIKDACDVIKNSGLIPSPKILSSLVSACRVHGMFDEAERLAKWLIDSEPENSANYALLSTLYAETGNWTGIQRVNRMLKKMRLTQNAGLSQIEGLVEY